MLILAIRTDKPEAEVALYNGQKLLDTITWEAHRILAVTLNKQIEKLLDKRQGLDLSSERVKSSTRERHKLSISTSDLEGIVVFKGPGSFTGLRIGVSVANTLAYSLNIPVTAKSGEDWQIDGIKALESGQNDIIAVPGYGSPAKTTKPRK